MINCFLKMCQILSKSVKKKLKLEGLVLNKEYQEILYQEYRYSKNILKMSRTLTKSVKKIKLEGLVLNKEYLEILHQEYR